MYTKESIKKDLILMSEKKYSDFSRSLIPGEDMPEILGVRIPKLREYAKKIASSDYEEYLQKASQGDMCFEEYMLKGFVIGYAKTNVDTRLSYIKDFVIDIDNWSVNDSFCATLKFTTKNRSLVWDFLKPYIASKREFDRRFAAIMLMDYFLVDEYIDRVLQIYDNMCSDGYYAMMGIAWAIATAYAKYPEKTHEYLLNCNLSDETFNKAIQKMLESYRVSADDKIKLKALKRS